LSGKIVDSGLAISRSITACAHGACSRCTVLVQEEDVTSEVQLFQRAHATRCRARTAAAAALHGRVFSPVIGYEWWTSAYFQRIWWHSSRSFGSSGGCSFYSHKIVHVCALIFFSNSSLLPVSVQKRVRQMGYSPASLSLPLLGETDQRASLLFPVGRSP